jgi:hypothetical protein
MPDYRLYLLDPTRRHITGAREMTAENDDEAIEQAREQHPTQPVELWSEGRKLTMPPP